MMGHIVCWRSGQVVVARRVPRGAMQLVTGHGRRLNRVLGVCARHAYDGKTLLVPGVHEAKTDVEALEAVRQFKQMLLKRLARGPHRRTKEPRLL